MAEKKVDLKLTTEQKLKTLRRLLLASEKFLAEIDATNPGINDAESGSVIHLKHGVDEMLDALLTIANGVHWAIGKVWKKRVQDRVDG